jgi:hypothetical protein
MKGKQKDSRSFLKMIYIFVPDQIYLYKTIKMEKFW